MNKLCYNDFKYLFKPKGAGTFSTALNFMEEHSDYAVCYYYYKITTNNVDGPNDEGRKFKQVHKVDEPHKGSRLQSTMWTDPMTRVENLNKPTNWTDLTKGLDSSPQCGRTQ